MGVIIMLFVDLAMWICMGLFLVGLVFIFESTLSSIFGFALVGITSIYFAVHFWFQGMLVFAILFGVAVLFAIRFLIGQASINRKNRWR